jgi:hypothetical protein
MRLRGNELARLFYSTNWRSSHRVARQLIPQVMAATPGSGVDAATEAQATANASVGKHA